MGEHVDGTNTDCLWGDGIETASPKDAATRESRVTFRPLAAHCVFSVQS